MATQIQLRRGTSGSWTSINPVLTSGEPGFETDTGRVKYGDGVTAWIDLEYSDTDLQAVAPTSDQKAALAGTGAPSSVNKFVTADGLTGETNSRVSGDAAVNLRVDAIPNVFIDPTRPPYNMIADNGYHALSERYATLADAQVDYPFATALTQQIDYCALRKAVLASETAGGGVIWLKRITPVIQQQVQWASRTHLLGTSDARTVTQGLNVGSTITNFSTNTFEGTPITATVTTAANVTTLSLIGSFTDLKPNIPIRGNGIRVGTTIASVNTGAGTAVLSHAATVDGVGVTITPGKAMINTTGCIHSSFHRCNFNYVGVFGTNCSMGISDFEGGGTTLAGFVTVERCNFNNFGGPMIGLYGNVNFIENNRIDQNGGDFLRIASSGSIGVGSDGWIRGNSTGYCYGNGSSPGATGDGIRMMGGYYSICDNDMYNCSIGIEVINSISNRIIGNRCEKNDLHGISITGSSTVNQTVMGNVCFNNGYVVGSTGISVSGIASRVTISGNVVANDIFASGPSFTATANGSTTISVVSSFTNLVAGQRIVGGANVPAGTYVQSINSGASTAVLTQAVTAGAGITFTTLPTNVGISISGLATQCVVSHNVVCDMNAQGLSLNNATYILLGGNTVSVCGTQGIIQSGASSTGNNINSNYVYNASQLATNSYDGINLNAGTLTLVHGDSIFGPATAKVRYGVRIENGCTGTECLDCYCVGGNYVSGAFNDASTNNSNGTIVRNFRGYVIGAITVAVPATTVAIASAPYDRFFYILGAAGGSTSIAIPNGPTVVVPASTAATPPTTLFVPAATVFTPTYGGGNPPTWGAYAVA